ncbi:hypothetical protein ACODT3_42525 [Streptomyces sp. 4.24]|uniref:hypothetical protein n=1 Tax=Streptomyces tritrimontium TaxID=3406573 RepID=UPI003BB708DA
MHSINIRSAAAAGLLALLAVLGLGIAAGQHGDTNWGIAAEEVAEAPAVPVTPAPPVIQPRDSDWG